MNQANNIQLEELNSKGLLLLLWSQKKILMYVTFLFAFISIIYSLSLQNKYTSSALVKVVTSNEQTSNASSFLSSYGGLASLSGIDISTLSDEKSSYVITLIKSKKFLNELLEKDDSLRQKILAIKKYHHKSGKVEFDNNIYKQEEGIWVRKVEVGRSIKPSYIELHEYYLSSLNIYKDKDSGFIHISFTSKSPVFAFNILEMIISEANIYIKEEELKKVDNSLNYLSSKLKTITADETINTINELIEVNLKKEALLNMNKEYYIEKIEYPFIAEEKSSPNRAIICILLTILGFLTSVIYVLVNNYIKHESWEV